MATGDAIFNCIAKIVAVVVYSIDPPKLTSCNTICKLPQAMVYKTAEVTWTLSTPDLFQER